MLIRPAPAPLLVALTLAGCSPSVPEGRFRCAAPLDCPEGWVCNDAGRFADGLCYSSTEAAPQCFAGLGDAVDRGQLDLLLVIDDTAQADQMQMFATALAELSRALAIGRLPDGSTFAPLDVRVGVVTTNMGASGLDETQQTPMAGCVGLGDDGRLRTTGSASIEGCPATYPVPFQSLAVPPGSTGQQTTELAEQFFADVSCLTTVLKGLCHWEQPLEAALKALTPSDSAIRFADDTHGRGSEHGFWRDQSILAIVVATNEDDWSVRDPELFSSSSDHYTGNIYFRGFKFPEALHPLQRYAEGFRSLRPQHPERLVFAAFAGIPDDLSQLAENPPYDAILEHPTMEQRPHPSSFNGLQPVCTGPQEGWHAVPARRLVELARDLGGVLQSSCKEDLVPGMHALARQITQRVEGTCR